MKTLTILTGADAPAVRAYIARALTEATADGAKSAVLLVPAQSSFIRDRELLLQCGARARSRFQVTGFEHFARDLLERRDIPVKPQADSAAAAVLMSLALRQTVDSLRIYARHAAKAASVQALLRTYEAVRQAGCDPETLRRLSARAEGSLRGKAHELALIFSAYDALLTPRFSTAADNVRRAALLLQKETLFADAPFFLDDFRSFTAVQLQLIEALLGQTDVTVALPGPTDGNGAPLFERSLKEENRLLAAARRAGARVLRRAAPDRESDGVFGHLRRNLFAVSPAPWPEETDAITITKAANRYEECERVALQIRALLETGYCRARDIAVLLRDPLYMPALFSAMKNCGLPVFEDKRRPLGQYPPARALLHAACAAAKGFATDELLALLKTELTGISPEETALLENYVFRWQIDGAQWTRPFEKNPNGFGAPMDDGAKALLQTLNDARERFIAPLIGLRETFRGQDARENCRALYLWLKGNGADDRFRAYAEYQNANGGAAQAQACARAWEGCMQALDALAEAAGAAPVQPVCFYELLSLLFSDASLGEIPTGVDEILIGTVERSRALSPRAVFVAGLNDGVFPTLSAGDGIFTLKETRQLSRLEPELARLPEETYEEEQLIAFSAFTAPAGRLFLSYAAADTGGDKLAPSPFITDLRAAVPHPRLLDAGSLPPETRIGSAATAFALYAERMDRKDAFTASLRAALARSPDMAARLAALERAAAGIGPVFASPEEAVRLFGKDLYFSASKAESYAKCPFAYFCRYGMDAQALRPERIDVRINGLLVHEALEKLLRRYPKEALIALPDGQLRAEIAAAVTEYADACMGGREGLSADQKRTLDRTERSILQILERIRAELGDCDFVPADMELAIGGPDAVLPAYRLPLPDGGSVSLTGSVDRVDLLKTARGNYVRVIDYKTGGKQFRLRDVFCGLNMQMLLYLFAICENGGARYGPLNPAGILYVPAKAGGETVGRNSTEEEVREQKLKNGRMNGMVLADPEILNAMEHGAEGRYLNAYIDKKGEMKGDLLTAEEFRLLREVTDGALIGTGEALHAGRIPAEPADDGRRLPCEFCDYAPVCLKEAGRKTRPVPDLKHEAARAKLRGKKEENDG